MSQQVTLVVKHVSQNTLRIRLTGLAEALPDRDEQATLLMKIRYGLLEERLATSSQLESDDSLVVTYTAEDANHHLDEVRKQVLATCEKAGIQVT